MVFKNEDDQQNNAGIAPIVTRKTLSIITVLMFAKPCILNSCSQSKLLK